MAGIESAHRDGPGNEENEMSEDGSVDIEGESEDEIEEEEEGEGGADGDDDAMEVDGAATAGNPVSVVS